MRLFRFKFWHLGILGIVLILILSWAATYLEISVPQPFNFIHRITAPFHRSVTWLGDRVSNVRSFFTNYRDFQEQRAYYDLRIAQLEKELQMMEEIYRENQRLRSLLDFSQRVNYETVGARVIGMGADSWGKSLLIDLGKRDGLAPRQPVISRNGLLVGQVDEVYARTARVTMLTHPGFVVGGIVEREESRALGMVRGTPLEEGLYLMDNFSWDADIEEGDVIITSGMSEFFPRGLIIGQVETIQEGDYGLTQEVGIRPSIYGQTVEEVLILLGDWGEQE